MSDSDIIAYDCNECGVAFICKIENDNHVCPSCNNLVIPITREMAWKINILDKMLKLRRRGIHLLILAAAGFIWILTINIHFLLRGVTIFIFSVVITLNIQNIYRLTQFIRMVKKDVRN